MPLSYRVRGADGQEYGPAGLQDLLTWVFVVGMVFYGPDDLLFLLVGDWFGLAFHVFVLFCRFKSLEAARALNTNA
jgi:hypothetical protein